MQRITRACASVVLIALAACRHHAPAPFESDLPALAAFASQRVVLTPTTFVHASDSLGWVAQLGGARNAGRALDSALALALEARGIAPRWILPPELERTFERNRTYASDPYRLTADALRLASFKAGSRFGDPLASQLRTMIALHEDTRFVFMPIALRFDRSIAPEAGGTALVRAALLDARTTEARWVADIRGDSAATAAAAIASVASRIADNFGRP